MIIGGGGIKTTRTYNEDQTLSVHVKTLQMIDKELSDLEEKINSSILDSQESGEDLMIQLATKKLGLKDMVANILSQRQNNDKDIKDRINALIAKELNNRKNDANAVVEAGKAYQSLFVLLIQNLVMPSTK